MTNDDTDTEHVMQLSHKLIQVLDGSNLAAPDVLTCLTYTIFVLARAMHPQRNNEELAVLNDKAFRTLIGEMEDIGTKLQ